VFSHSVGNTSGTTTAGNKHKGGCRIMRSSQGSRTLHLSLPASFRNQLCWCTTISLRCCPCYKCL